MRPPFGPVLLAAVLVFPQWPGVVRAQDIAIDMKPILAAPANPLDLEVTTSTEGAVTRTIDETGGTIEITIPSGATFTLDIPKGALAGPVDVTLAPVTSIKGLPDLPTKIHAVDMLPSGLKFLEPATLSLRLPQNARSSRGLMLGYDGNGLDAYLHPFIARDGRLVRQIAHFSGNIFWELQLARNEQEDAESRAEEKQVLEAFLATIDVRNAREQYKRGEAEVAKILAKERQCQLAGTVCSPEVMARVCEIHDRVSTKQFDATYGALMAPGTNCAMASTTLRDSLSMERGSQIYGCTKKTTLFTETRSVLINGKRESLTMSGLVLRICENEANDLCKKSGEVAELVQTALAVERQRQLVGEGSDMGLDIVKKLQTCGKFEVTIENRSKEHHIDLANCTVDVGAKVTLKGEIGWSGDIANLSAAGDASHKLDDYKIGLRCAPGDAYRMVGWRSEAPARITLGFDHRRVPSRTPGKTVAEIVNYYVLVDPGSITKNMEAKTLGTSWTAFPWGDWFKEEFLEAYRRKAKPAGILFKVPATGEHPQVGNTIDQGRGKYVSPGQVKSEVVIDSVLTIRHLPPTISNGNWQISDPRN